MPRPATRKYEILELLAHYGVMSTKIMLTLLKNQMSSRSLRKTLHELARWNLVVNATSGIGGSPVSFWMLSNNEDSLKTIESILSQDRTQFRIKHCRYTHYPHEDLCTLFQVSMELQFPHIKILRESHYGLKELPQIVLSEQLRGYGYKPDLCLGLPLKKGEKGDACDYFKWIAVEIDRSYRSHLRVAKRCNLYTRHAGFEGLLYMTPTQGTIAPLVDEFCNRGARKSLRMLKNLKNRTLVPVTRIELVHPLRNPGF